LQPGAEVALVHVVSALPALPPDPNYLFRVPEYEQALHADAQRSLQKLADEIGKRGGRRAPWGMETPAARSCASAGKKEWI
jgi:hypothetical protein